MRGWKSPFRDTRHALRVVILEVFPAPSARSPFFVLPGHPLRRPQPQSTAPEQASILREREQGLFFHEADLLFAGGAMLYVDAQHLLPIYLRKTATSSQPTVCMCQGLLGRTDPPPPPWTLSSAFLSVCLSQSSEVTFLWLSLSLPS